MDAPTTHFRLRLPSDLARYVREEARHNERSINGEIVYVLRQQQKTASEPTA